MNRTIFLRELRAGLIQGVASTVPAMGILFAARWLEPPDHLMNPIGLFPIALASLAVLLWIIGFGSGARTFALEDRGDQWLFWYSLPVSRNALWLSMVGGRMIAALLCIGLLLVAFLLSNLPGLLPPQWSQARMEWLPLAMSVCATIFASGCCLSLVARRTLVIHVAGLALFWTVHLPTVRYARLGSREPVAVGFDELFVSVLFFFITAVLTMLSWLFFRRGELHIWKRRLVNQGALVMTLASTLLLARTITRPPLVDFIAGPWIQSLTPPRPGGPLRFLGIEWLVSAGGRYLAIVESLDKKLGYSRVNIIETATGRLVGRRRWDNLDSVDWERREQVLRIYSTPSAGGASGTVMQRVTPESRVLSQSRLRPLRTAGEFPILSFVYTDQRFVRLRPNSLILYVRTDGRAALYDGTLARQIPLSACTGRAFSPELIPIRNNLAFLVRIQCGDAGAQHRHFYYLPGSGTVTPVPVLDQVMKQTPDILAYLDEQTVIWKEGETWKSLRQGKLRVLWPL